MFSVYVMESQGELVFNDLAKNYLTEIVCESTR